MHPDTSVTVGALVEYLATFDPNSPVLLRDWSHYNLSEVEAGGCVSVEQAMYELGARPAD